MSQKYTKMPKNEIQQVAKKTIKKKKTKSLNYNVTLV